MVDTQVSATPYYIGRFPDSQDLRHHGSHCTSTHLLNHLRTPLKDAPVWDETSI